MSTHLIRLHGGPAEGPPLLAPVRALGALERRMIRRRPRTGAGSATPAASGSQATAPSQAKLVYWVGDERETTQGDW